MRTLVILFTMLDFSRQPHRRFNRSERDMGAGIAPPHATALAGPSGENRADAAAGIRSRLLPLSRECARRRRTATRPTPARSFSITISRRCFPTRPPGPWIATACWSPQANAGICRVVCFSPRHDLTVARMSVPDLTLVVDVWAAQYAELGAPPAHRPRADFRESRRMMGASNPHPHCQIWASSSIPTEVAAEQRATGGMAHCRGSCLLCDYLALERESGERLVCENESFAALVPSGRSGRSRRCSSPSAM